jgi:hypothetical protein
MFDKLKNLFKKAEAPIEGYQPLTEGTIQGAMSPKAKPKANTRPKAPPGQDAPKKKRTTKKKTETALSAKEQATAKGEPYVSILKVDVDPNDINNGSFDLDWNDKFVLNLIKAGYKMKPDDTDADIVDRWFTQVCRNVVLEMYEQQQADPDTRAQQMRVIQQRDIGDGRTEVS